MQKKCVDKDFYAQIFLLFALFLCWISTYSQTIKEWSKFIILNVPRVLIFQQHSVGGIVTNAQ